MKERASAMKKPKKTVFIFAFRYTLKLRREGFIYLFLNKILKARGDKRALVGVFLEND